MRILIMTPLYPPQVGGPAKYAFHLQEELKKNGHRVKVIRYGGIERHIPTILRHFALFLRSLPKVLWSERIISLDAVSVGLPAALASRVFRKKLIIRLGGDFLWETFVERTKQKITLLDFYEKEYQLSQKERIIKRITAYAVNSAKTIVVNTPWFSQIVSKVYRVSMNKIVCVENVFPGVTVFPAKQKTFIASSRQLELKNLSALKEVFSEIKDANLIVDQLPPDKLKDAIRDSYAVIVCSYSEVSPNLIMEGIALGKPFIVTRYTGLSGRFSKMGLFVDPFDRGSIKNAVLQISNPEIYKNLVDAISSCTYSHSWNDIGKEFEELL